MAAYKPPAVKPIKLPVQKPVPGVEPGDHIYVQHPTRGPMAVRVLAKGRDGVTAEDGNGARHQMLWEAYLGTRARVLSRHELVDQGADGALLKDENGKHRYVAGTVAARPAAAADTTPADQDAYLGPKDDPLKGGLERLSKAMVFLKATIANRPGLSLKPVTDKAGHQTKRWVTTSPKQAAPEKGKAGDDFFQRTAQQNADRKAAAAKHGAEPGPLRMKHADGRSALVSEDMSKPGSWRTSNFDKEGPSGHAEHPDKTAAVHAAMRDGFNPDEPNHGAPMEHGQTVAFRHGDVGGTGKVVGSGADGVTVKDKAGKEHMVRHEHLVNPETGETPAAAEPEEPATDIPGPDPAGELPKPPAEPEGALFDPAEMALPAKAKQPVSDGAELYAKAPEALDQLQEWLDKGKGICSQLGYETMMKPPEDVDWSSAPKGGMLFIAPLKGEKRAAEKVESDFGGDWSQLLDPVRCSIAVDDISEVKATLDKLRASGKLKLARAPKDRFAKPTDVGYRDILLNVTMPNGIISEVQLHLKSMLAAKAEGHKPYETMRTIDSKPPEKRTPEEIAAWDDAFQQSVAIYGKAWSEGSEMTKAMGAGEFCFFEHENAHFRRKGDSGGVHDVLHGDKWVPYTGNRTDPALYGNREGDPSGQPMRKALVLARRAA